MYHVDVHRIFGEVVQQSATVIKGRAVEKTEKFFADGNVQEEPSRGEGVTRIIRRMTSRTRTIRVCIYVRASARAGVR